MKKLKVMIVSMLGAIALVFACVVGTRVNAATLNDVRTISSDGTTSSWNFASSSIKALGSNYTIAEKQIDYIDGMTNDDSKGAKVNKTGYIELAVGKDFYLSLPSSDSAGKFKFTCVDNITSETAESDQRTVTVGGTTLYSSATEQEIAFTSSYATTINGLDGYWLQISCNSKKVARIVSASIVLTTGNYITSYNVNFFKESSDTEAYATRTVFEGSTVSNWPDNPTKDGYDFIRWETSSDEIYTSTSVIESDVDLYAVWQESGVTYYTVTFVVDGTTYSSKSVTAGSGVQDMPADPVKSNYTFNGWLDENGNEFTNSNITKNQKVYADFTINSKVTTIGEVTLTGINATTENTNADTVINSNITVKADSTNTVEFGSSKKTADDNVQVADYVKLKGDGSTTYRSIKVTISLRSRVTFYMVSSSSSKTAPYQISDVNGNSVATGTLTASGTVSANVYTLEAGTYYLYGKRTNTSTEGNLNVYSVSIAESYYNPNVSLAVEANNNNTKVRVTATIDNVNIVSGKVNGVESMQYAIDGTTWSKDVTNVYTSVDAADSGFYSAKNYTVYAIVVFDGYNKVKADFDVTFTVTLAGGQTVSKTITVVKPSA